MEILACPDAIRSSFCPIDAAPFQFVERKLPIKEMGRKHRRHGLTIYREIRRNTFRDRELPLAVFLSVRTDCVLGAETKLVDRFRESRSIRVSEWCMLGSIGASDRTLHGK
ncbi:hypothetical protein NE863_35350 (plasmid) [Ensifer adhaerens]|uniref:Uncharacterized protein n=1 Tax=Ensifer adhaerens TaxID=106592 RepID=A0A9Q9DEX8_ENSAD|nr:hypothetical protein [Ensifer adhaerens]USJ28417.1 hypothetical protein NE863_35350 [Ensifer adhaerens]